MPPPRLVVRTGHLRQVTSSRDGWVWVIGDDQRLYGLSPRLARWQRQPLHDQAAHAVQHMARPRRRRRTVALERREFRVRAAGVAGSDATAVTVGRPAGRDRSRDLARNLGARRPPAGAPACCRCAARCAAPTRRSGSRTACCSVVTLPGCIRLRCIQRPARHPARCGCGRPCRIVTATCGGSPSGTGCGGCRRAGGSSPHCRPRAMTDRDRAAAR